MVILAVDYGDARTGLAVCDKMELLASPVCVISERYAPKLTAQIAQHAAQLRAERIVVGHPLNMDGSAGERANKCEVFAGLLQESCGIPVELWDERLTTVCAHHALNATNTRGAKRKAVVDAVAATMILEGFLRARKKEIL